MVLWYRLPKIANCDVTWKIMCRCSRWGCACCSISDGSTTIGFSFNFYIQFWSSFFWLLIFYHFLNLFFFNLIPNYYYFHLVFVLNLVLIVLITIYFGFKFFVIENFASLFFMPIFYKLIIVLWHGSMVSESSLV